MSAKSKNSSRVKTTGGKATVMKGKSSSGGRITGAYKLTSGIGRRVKASRIVRKDKVVELLDAMQIAEDMVVSGSRKDPADPARPVAGRIATVARSIADEYQIILTNEDDEWYGHGLEMPKVMADGKTVAQCVKNTREAMTAAVAYMIESGQVPPSPAKEGKRTEQVNIRLGAMEKFALTFAAKQKGFKSLADFLRASALDASH